MFVSPLESAIEYHRLLDWIKIFDSSRLPRFGRQYQSSAELRFMAEDCRSHGTQPMAREPLDPYDIWPRGSPTKARYPVPVVIHKQRATQYSLRYSSEYVEL